MTPKEILNKIKAVFNAVPVVADATVGSPVVYKTKDGLELTIVIEDPAVSMTPDAGDVVTVAGVPAPAGDYELEDGSKITIDEAGLVSDYTPVQPVTQPEFVAPVEPIAPAMPTVEERLTAIEARLTALESAEVSEATEMMSRQLQAASQKADRHEITITGLFELVEKLIEEPTATPATIPENKKDSFANQKEARVERMATAMKELRTSK